MDQLKVHNSRIYNNVGNRSIYQNIQLFIRSRLDILNAVVYSLHKFGLSGPPCSNSFHFARASVVVASSWLCTQVSVKFYDKLFFNLIQTDR